MSDIQIATTIKDSGKRQDFDTGSKRDTRDGKGRFDLLPSRAITRLARHFEGGAVKYGDRNWEKGQPLSRYWDSAVRHAFKYIEGHRDEDHLIAGAWNLMCLADTEQRIVEGLLPSSLNDIPVLGAAANKKPALSQHAINWVRDCHWNEQWLADVLSITVEEVRAIRAQKEVATCSP